MNVIICTKTVSNPVTAINCLPLGPAYSHALILLYYNIVTRKALQYKIRKEKPRNWNRAQVVIRH